MPSFSITPARITEPAVGASVCASGSQVCSGKSGTLIANARKNAPKSSSSVSCGNWSWPDCDQAADVRQIEGAGHVVEPEDRDQHQDRAEHRVQNEFHGGVDAALVSPHADHEIHRDQRELPEDEEEEQIERDEDADHGRFDHQQRDEEALHVFVDRFPGAEDRERREERGEQDQKQADAVDAEVVVDGLADPVVTFPRIW